jgi:hypothetical protein
LKAASSKQYKRYIPTIAKKRLDKLDYPRKDNLYCILDLIYRKQVYFKTDLQKRYGYAEIAKAQFKELIPSSDYLQEDLNFLIELGIVMRNEFYRIKDQCKRYKIASEYLGKQVGILIEDNNINRRIKKQIQGYRRRKVKNLEFAKSGYFKTFKIDVAGGTKAILDNAIKELKELAEKQGLQPSDKQLTNIIECKANSVRGLFQLNDLHRVEFDNILHKYMIHTMRLNSIADGYLFFKRNKTNDRLDSNLTSLPKFLRPFIISDERLVSIDIKNSQPYFLYTSILSNPDINTNELAEYGELVLAGTLYEYLIDKYKKLTYYERNRDQMKIMLCKILYSKRTSFGPYKKFFGSLFPSIMKYVNITNCFFNNTLAIELTKAESNAVLDVVMPHLESLDIRPFTIHDSFICKESEADAIEATLNSKMIELFGVAPKVKREYIDEIEEEGEIIDMDAFISKMGWDKDD